MAMRLSWNFIYIKARSLGDRTLREDFEGAADLA